MLFTNKYFANGHRSHGMLFYFTLAHRHLDSLSGIFQFILQRANINTQFYYIDKLYIRSYFACISILYNVVYGHILVGMCVVSHL